MNDVGEDANRRETIVPHSNSEASADHYVQGTGANPADFTDFEAQDKVETEDTIRKALIDFFWVIDNYCELKTANITWKERLINHMKSKPFKAQIIAKIKDVIFGPDIPVPKKNSHKFECQLAN